MGWIASYYYRVPDGVDRETRIKAVVKFYMDKHQGCKAEAKEIDLVWGDGKREKVYRIEITNAN